MTYFHQNLKKLRKSRRYSQQEMANHFGVAQGSYSGWENRAEPQYSTLIEIAEFFDVSLDELLKQELHHERPAPRKVGGTEVQLVNEKVEALVKTVQALATKIGVDIPEID